MLNNYYQHDTREEYDAPSKYSKHQMMGSPYPMMQQQQRHPYTPPPNNMQPYFDSPYPVNFKYNKFHNEHNGPIPNSIPNNNNNNNRMNHFDGPMFETQPQMLSFKTFLQSLNQNLSPEQATKRYNEYKNSFRKEQIEFFFDAHKEEEWFKSRYHPDESSKRKDEYRSGIKRRLTIFMELYEKGYLENVCVDMDNYESLKKFLCAVIIKLEDGNDEDLKVLEEQQEVVEIENKNDDDVIVVLVDDGGEKKDVEVKQSVSNINLNSDDENADYDKDDVVCIDDGDKNENSKKLFFFLPRPIRVKG
jgi:hypothetical protein